MKRNLRLLVLGFSLLLVVLYWNFVTKNSINDFERPVPNETVRAKSPAGWCVAYAVEFDFGPESQNTQVILSFDGGRCGSGAVSFPGLHLELKLRWLDDMTLEVQHPNSAAPTRNASGEVLQCRQRKVRVLLIHFESR